MKSTNYFKPYNGKKTALKEVSASGVYFIKEGKEVVYVGYSETQLKKTIYRHLQSWKDHSQKRATFDRDKVEVKVIFCSPTKAKILELFFIDKLKPKENTIIIKHLNPIFKKRAQELLEKNTQLNKEDYNEPF